MPIIINILAYLAILTLIAFFGVLIWGAIAVLEIVNEAKGKVGIINPPKQAALQIVSVGKGVAQRLAQRGKVIAMHGKEAAASVVGVKDDVVKVYRSIDIEGAKASAEQAADSIKASSNSEALAFFKQFVATMHDAQSAQNRS